MANESRRVPGRWRRIAFRIAAVLIGFAPLALSEASLCLCQFRRPADESDPFVGFSAVYPLFERDATGTRYETAQSRRQYFFPDSFAADKPDDEFRIFCVGGSTVAGHPYAPATSFTTFLEIGLQQLDPKRRWRVVNCGGISYATYRLAPIVGELLQCEPDLIVLCTGHNEFLEARTYTHRRRLPQSVAKPLAWFGRLRSVTLLRCGIESCCAFPSRCDEYKPILPAEVDAMLDYRGGIDDYHRDDGWRRDVIDHFAFNLRRMLDMAHTAAVPVLLVSPPANLRDCPPFKSEHRPGFSSEDLATWRALWDEARSHYRSNVRQAVALLEQAAALDDQHAGLFFELGQCREALGDWQAAHSAYLRAKELDVCPIRILEAMRDEISHLAKRTGVPLIDAHSRIAERSRGGVPGGDWLVDHVHPSIEGHQLIAEAIIEELADAGLVTPGPAADARRAAYRRHVASLPDEYFAHGAERLEMYRLWTQSLLGPARRSADERADRASAFSVAPNHP